MKESTLIAFDVNKVRKEFPALAQLIYGRPLVYLDNGATSQKPQVVIDAINHFYSTDNSNIHRGVHFLSQQATTLYEEARITIQKYINAPSTEEVLFTSGTTAAINLVAFSVMKFADTLSNLYPTNL